MASVAKLKADIRPARMSFVEQRRSVKQQPKLAFEPAAAARSRQSNGQGKWATYESRY